MTHIRSTHTDTFSAVCAICISFLICGCSTEPQRLVFSISGETSVSNYSFFPIVERGDDLVLGHAQSKTFDASGYHDVEISATHPRNLFYGWVTPKLSRYKRAGIVILRQNDEMKPLLESARVFWLKSETMGDTSDRIHISIPKLEALDNIDVQPNWY